MAVAEDRIRGIKATEYVQQVLSKPVEKPVDPDRLMLESLMRWDGFPRLVSKMYMDFQAAVDDADAATKAGEPPVSIGRLVGRAAALKGHLVWLTRYSNRDSQKSKES